MNKPTRKPLIIEAPKVIELSTAPRKHTKKSAIITVLAQSNPKRQDSLAYERFELYQTGMTVGEYVEAGGRSGDIKYDVQNGYIELSGDEDNESESDESEE